MYIYFEIDNYVLKMLNNDSIIKNKFINTQISEFCSATLLHLRI